MELFSSDLKNWEVKEGKDGVAQLVYKDKEVFSKNIPGDMTKTGIKDTLAYIKHVKTESVKAASEAMTEYLKQNKKFDKAVATVQTGLNSSDVINVTLTREKTVRIPGTDDTKKISQIQINDRCQSHHVPKSLLKEEAVKAAQVLIK